MKKILFRGQCEATNEWVYGLPVTETTLSNTISHIAQYSGKERKFGRTNVKIKPETIGQFTGLLDKNGNKIFENDILISTFYAGDEVKKMRVIYQKDCASFRLVSCSDDDKWSMAWSSQNQIIGNIHEDNTSKENLNTASSQTDVIRRFLEDISKDKNIPIEQLITGIMQGDLYVWDYDSGRHFQDQFRIVSINGE